MMDELVIATHNIGKVEEFKTLMQELHLNLITIGGNVDEDDEQFSLSWQR